MVVGASSHRAFCVINLGDTSIRVIMYWWFILVCALLQPLDFVSALRAPFILPDGRAYRIFSSKEELSGYIRDRVETIAAAAIDARGGFSMSIGSGTTVAPLVELATSSKLDFTKMHVFFGNERVEGSTAFKCFDGAQNFVQRCGIPSSNVYRPISGDAVASANAYSKLLMDLPSDVVGFCTRTGLPVLDLVLLGSGADGHTASLYPGSLQVLQNSNQPSVAAEGKGGITFSLQMIQSARNVLISASKPDQVEMVSKALAPGAATNTDCPAGMIAAADGTDVEWLLSEASAANFPVS
jgi:6-phosphogluconolactonase